MGGEDKMAGWTCPDRNDILWDGRIIADNFKGNGSELTGIAGDNLGNHIATQTVSGANIYATGNVSGANILIMNNNLISLSGAYYTHASDSSDPHGSTLTQTGIVSSGVISGAYYTGTSGAYFADRVGIGTASPNYPLSIKGGDASGYLQFETPTTGNQWHIGTYNSGQDLNFAETGVADGRLYLKQGGNVGIGTTSPTAKVSVKFPTTGEGVAYDWGNITSGTYGGIGFDTSGYIYMGYGAAEHFTIASTGNAWFIGNVSALSFTDRTPYPKDTAEAYEMINSFEGVDEKIDKEKMHEKLKSEDGRNLSLTVSALIEVVKDLKKEIEILKSK